MNDVILVLNAGSSSIKFSVYADDGLKLLCKGQIEGIGTAPHFTAKDATGTLLEDSRWPAAQAGHALALEKLGEWLTVRFEGAELRAVGHRVVHGGPDFDAPVLISTAVRQRLGELVPLAPLHQPHNLAGIDAVSAVRPDLPQVACFDTAFHRDHPRVADQYGLPEEFYQEGVRHYGFHGLSYEYIARSLPEIAPEIAGGRVVVAHLGSGASMCAIKDGHSVDSTMGFSALDGLLMGTRCGAIDPGVLLYLLQQKGMGVEQVEKLLYSGSGLRGMSGVSNDMRDLLASEEPRAAMALDYFAYRITMELGALAAVLSGLDALVFTAGIGERSPAIRARVCRDAAWLGVALDEAANEWHGPRISTAESRVSTWVVPTDEEGMIARHTLAALGRS